MGTYLYSVRKTGKVAIKLPDFEGEAGPTIIAHPLKYLNKPHTGWNDEYARRDTLLVENACRAWEGQDLPEYIFLEGDKRKAGEYCEFYRWHGGPIWYDSDNMKGEQVAFVKFVAQGTRLKAVFASAKEGLVWEYTDMAWKALQGRLAVDGLRGMDLAVQCRAVAIWLNDQSIPAMGPVAEWSKKASGVLREMVTYKKACVEQDARLKANAEAPAGA